MWFWVEEVLQLTNLTKWVNNQNREWAMKIRPKSKKMNLTSYDRILILDHEKISLIRFQDVFHEIWLKISFNNLWWKSFSHGVRWKKNFEIWWKNALCFEICVRSLSFHTSQTLMRWKILKTRKKSSLRSKISRKLSLLVSPLALQS